MADEKTETDYCVCGEVIERNSSLGSRWKHIATGQEECRERPVAAPRREPRNG